MEVAEASPKPTLADPVLTAEQVGELTGLSADGVRHAYRCGQLAGFTLRHRLRFRLSSVERWLAAAEQGAST